MNKNMDLVYKYCEELGLDKKKEEYFQEHASSIIERLREDVWEKEYKPNGLKKIRKKMEGLLKEDDFAPDMDPVDAIQDYIKCNIEDIYKICVSETQSRRSTTGTSFESILEIVLLLAGVPVESQVYVELGGKTQKKVDLLSPGLVGFYANREYVKLISLKTTLRERVDESVSEGKSGDIRVYMAHLDSKLSPDLIQRCQNHRMILVTTESVYDEYLRKANDRISKNEAKIKKYKSNIENWKEDLKKYQIDLEKRRDDGKPISALERSINKRIKDIPDEEKKLEECNELKSVYEKDLQNIKMNMMTFENFIKDCLDLKRQWVALYTSEQKAKVVDSYIELLKRNSDYKQIVLQYSKRIKELGLVIDDEDAKHIIAEAENKA